jgi:hypothetical protein
MPISSTPSRSNPVGGKLVPFGGHLVQPARCGVELSSRFGGMVISGVQLAGVKAGRGAEREPDQQPTHQDGPDSTTRPR